MVQKSLKKFTEYFLKLSISKNRMAFNIAPFNVLVVYASIKFMEKYVIFFTSGVLARIK